MPLAGPGVRASGRLPALVVFDCDGTLVDSEPIAAQVNSELLGALGWPITEEEVTSEFLGCSAPYFRAVAESRLGRPLPVDWDARFRNRFEEIAAESLEAVPGVEAVLEGVASAGLARCVASNSSRPRTLWSLTHTGLIAYFDPAYVFSARDLAAPKPAPDVFLHAADVLGVDVAATVVVEDSPIGVAAARAAGMTVFGYAGGLTPAALLAEATAVFVDMAELPALLGLVAGGRPSATTSRQG